MSGPYFSVAFSGYFSRRGAEAQRNSEWMSKENSASPRLRGRFSSNKHREGGVALVIVLAFVVLLTGLLLAFFSRTISERQVSNSSASQSKVDIFAQGAVDTLSLIHI